MQLDNSCTESVLWNTDSNHGRTMLGEARSSLLSMIAILVAALCVIALALTPLSAYAMDTAKCSARPNGSTGSDVYGGSVTRVTWEGQAAADEAVEGLSLTFPAGTTFGIDDSKVTVLSGDNLMDRQNVKASFSSDGETIIATFDTAVEAGSYIRLEVYDVVFPVSGGQMELHGTYTLSDGTIIPLEDISPLVVKGVSVTDQITSSLEEQDWVTEWNSNKFLRLFFNPVIIVESFPIVFQGFLMAVGIVAVAFPIAIPLGLCLSLMRMARLRILRGLASIYVNVVRGTPLFLQIYIAFFGLPLAGIQIPSFPLGVVVLSMNSAAYLCEIFRAGIQSIPKGQTEASRSLGMNGFQTMVFVIIPQTIKRVIPTMTSEFILLYKDTSMLAAVGVMEVVMYAKTIVASTGSITPYIVAACFYLVVTLPLAKLVGMLESRLDSGRSSRSKKAKHKVDGVNVGDSQDIDVVGVHAASAGIPVRKAPISGE